MSHNIKPRSRVSQSRVWVYFKQSDGDPDKARCNLCSAEICHRRTTNILWNHVKIKHSIDRNALSRDSQDNFEPGLQIPAKQRSNHQNNNTHLSNQNNSDLILDYNDLSLASMKPLPSNSLSKNLISRLNQLSSPVTRKLKFWNKKSFQVNQYDPSFKVIYLGNLGVQLWSKDESCLDKPLSTLWNNYLVNMKTEIVMRLTICNSGLKAITRQHGLTQYWSNRLVYCCSHKNYPRIFSWVYRHEGKKMRQELRCHAVFCPSPERASKMVILLNERISCALQEFRREKKSRGPSTIVTQNESPFHQNLQRTVPLRRQILAKGSANFRPPLERSKSAPKLTSILEEEDYESSEDEIDEQLHDVFEYEESFGDKDDVDEDSGGNISDKSAVEDNGANKIESNSLTTTVNEDTSNSSAYATGDRSQEKRKPNSDDLCVESFDYPDNSTTGYSRLSSAVHNNHINGSIGEVSKLNLTQTKEYNSIMEPWVNNESIHESTDHQNRIHNHKNQNHINHDHNLSHRNQNESANTIISSSSDKRLIINQVVLLRQEINDNNKLLLVNQNNHGASSNINEPSELQTDQQSDDAPTNEIISSWSNLVIK